MKRFLVTFEVTDDDGLVSAREAAEVIADVVKANMVDGHRDSVDRLAEGTLHNLHVALILEG